MLKHQKTIFALFFICFFIFHLALTEPDENGRLTRLLGKRRRLHQYIVDYLN